MAMSSIQKWAPSVRQISLLRSRMPSMIAYTGALGLFGLFFTASWFGKSVLKNVPIYNTKYEEKDKD